MRIDLSIVVFRPDTDLLLTTLMTLSKVRSEVGSVRVLVSGSNFDFANVREIVLKVGLLSQAVLTHRYDNLGFASGHNLLLADAFRANADAVLIVNPDMEFDKGAISALGVAASSSDTPALYGPVIRRVVKGGGLAEMDSAGIVWTATGRHFDNLQGMPDVEADRSLRLVKGLTGACLLVSRAAHARIVGQSGYFFDDLFVAYREDAELGVRAALLNIPSVCVNVSGFFHVRSVRGATRGNALADLLGVRNRFIMKHRMLGHRPGWWLLANLRDLLVIAATVTKERTSLPGLLSVFRMRRFLKYTSAYHARRRNDAA